MLTVWLDYQRATLLWKCEELDGAALVRHGVPPSSLTLLGLVRHMTLVEWWWFDHIFTGSTSPEPFSTKEDRDADFNDLDPARAMADLDLFQRQCDVSRAIVAVAPGLDTLAVVDREAAPVPPLDHGPHDRGVRTPQRACRSAARADRRRRGGVSARDGGTDAADAALRA